MTPAHRCWIVIAVAILPVPLGAQGAAPVSPRVVSYSSDAKAPTRWTVAAKPILEFGGIDGIGPTEFTRIAGLTRQTDGTFVVANGETRELRFFDARGRFRRSATRRGEGPGEIYVLTRMFAIDDTLVVVDNWFEFHVYAPNGKWIRSLILPPVPGYIVSPAVGALSAFDLVAPLRGGSEQALRERRYDELRRDSTWFARARLRDTSVLVLLGERHPPSFASRPGGPLTYPFGFAPRTLIAVTRARICTGYPERYEVLCSDSLGRAQLRISRATTPGAVTDSARRAYRNDQAGRLPDGTSRYEGGLRAHRERVAAAVQFASRYPAYSRLLFARTGELWVRAFATAHGMGLPSELVTYAAASSWSIFDRDGRWIADCTLPPHFAPAEIGADYVLGVSRDEDEVERVTLLSLRRSFASRSCR